MAVPIAILERFALIAAFLGVPSISRMLSIQRARAEGTNNDFSCAKRRSPPAKIDYKEG